MNEGNIFSNIEKKTNVKKEDIINLAKEIQGKNLKDEKTLRDLIQKVGKVAGKNVSKEKEDKIIEAIQTDKLTKSFNKFN